MPPHLDRPALLGRSASSPAACVALARVAVLVARLAALTASFDWHNLTLLGDIPIMACPTCDHTMHYIGATTTAWCPRCGTLKHDDESTDVPELVKRMRKFDHANAKDANLIGKLRLSGIIEAIYRPKQRYV